MQQVGDKVKAFWIKWLEADELEQLRLVESLSLPTNVIRDEAIYKYHAASLINRYIEDFTRALASMSAGQLRQALAPYKPESFDD